MNAAVARIYGRAEGTIRRHAFNMAAKIPGVVNSDPKTKLLDLRSSMVQGSSEHPRAGELF